MTVLSDRKNVISRCAVALLTLVSITLGGFIPPASAEAPASTRLSTDQRILHVLNRLGYGARPGDVERVKAMGLDNYINQQLNPETISDTVAQDKVKNLETLSMTTAQLYERFPQPGRW